MLNQNSSRRRFFDFSISKSEQLREVLFFSVPSSRLQERLPLPAHHWQVSHAGIADQTEVLVSCVRAKACKESELAELDVCAVSSSDNTKFVFNPSPLIGW